MGFSKVYILAEKQGLGIDLYRALNIMQLVNKQNASRFSSLVKNLNGKYELHNGSHVGVMCFICII